MDIKSIDWEKLEEGEAVVDYLYNQWRKKILVIVKFLGLSGMGKSYASLRLGELLAKKMHGDKYKISRRNIVKNLLELIRFIKSVEMEGEIMIIEEMSVLFPSRRAMSGSNVDANAIIDTVRKKGIIIIGNYPLNKTVDSHIEAMCCLQLVTMQLNKTKGISIVSPLRLQTNPVIPKTYHHKLIDKKGNEIDYTFFRLPSKELINPYELEKDKLMDDLYERLEAKEKARREMLDKQVSKINRKGTLQSLSQRQLEVYNLIFKQNKRITDVANELGLAPSNIAAYLKVIKEKLLLENSSKN